jgi:serine/threonine-protein kinase
LHAKQLFAELKRRHVIRLAIVYLIVGWIVIQVADTVFPALEIPDWGLRLVIVMAILGFPIAIVIAWGYDLTRAGVVRTPADSSAPSPVSAELEAGDKSIAVLPFVNMSDDKENEYFSDGITEEIINALTKVEDLQVVARSSAFAFKSKDIDIREVGNKLGVATVLEGSVRKAGNRVRITSQLIRVTNGYHLWSETYDRELADVFAIQDEIARAIVDALKVQLHKDDAAPLVVQSTGSMEAYTLYLKGRFIARRFTERDTYLSLDLFAKALEHDPKFAQAYTGIADSWMLLADDWVAPREAYPRAKEAARQALALDPNLAEAHTALGKVLGWFDWDFDSAELALRRAVGANPKYAEAHWGLASVLPPSGRLQEAIRVLRTALTLDPLSALYARWVARYELYARNYDAAIEHARKALELDRYHTPAYAVIGSACLAKGETAAALRVYDEGAKIGNVPFFDAFRARAYAVAGRTSEARALLHALEAEAAEKYIRPEALAEGYTALGEYDHAFELLEKAYEARTATLMYLHIDPAFDALHSDPRFELLTKRIGLRS